MKCAVPYLVTITRCFREMLGICGIIHTAGKFLLFPRLVQAQESDASNLYVML